MNGMNTMMGMNMNSSNNNNNNNNNNSVSRELGFGEGKVSALNTGFGFIARPNLPDLFFHFSEWPRPQDTIVPGTKISFECGMLCYVMLCYVVLHFHYTITFTLVTMYDKQKGGTLHPCTNKTANTKHECCCKISFVFICLLLFDF